MRRSKPFKSDRDYESFVPGPFTGVKAWARFHRRAGTQPTKIKGDPDRYLHSMARGMKALRTLLAANS